MKMYRYIIFLWCIIHSFSCFAHQVDSLLSALKASEKTPQKIAILLQLSGAYMYNDPQKQFDFAIQSQVLFQESNIKNDSLLAEILFTVGKGYEAIEQNKEALNSYKEAIIIADQLDWVQLKSIIANEEGLIFDKIGHFDLAIESYQRGLEMAETVGDKKSISTLINNIALIYCKLKEFKKAQELFKQNYEASQIINDVHGGAIALSNLGDVCLKQGNLDEAINFYKRSLHIVDSLNLNFGIMTNHLHLGETYCQKGFEELALEHNELAYQIAKKAGFQREIAKAALSISKIKLAQKDFEYSIAKAEEALQFANTLNSKEDAFEIHLCLSKNYEQLGDFQTALQHHQQFEAIRDSFFDEDKLNTFAELEYRFATKKKEAENQFLKSEQIKNETIIQQKTFLVWSIGISLIILGFAVWILYQKNKQNRTYNTVLEEQVEERTQHLKASNERLTIANKELEQFAYITSHDLKEPLRNISGFSSLIKRNILKGNYESIEEYLQFINQNTSQMSNLIDDILAYSKIGKIDVSEKKTFLAVLVEKTKRDLQRLMLEKRGRIVYKNPWLYEKATMIQIPTTCTIIFKNLIENGIKYNKTQNPTVRIGYTTDETFMIFTFQDNGIGIEKEYREKVFEMFKRLHHRGEYEGSGIGLAICKKMVETLHGSLEIIQSNAQGSTFELKIPIQAQTEKEAYLNSQSVVQ